MPIYEYECRECGHAFDALQKISDPRLVDCPECGKAGLRKLVSAPNFRLKGSGWYETDFKKDNQKNLAGDRTEKSAGKSDSGSADGASKSDSGKSEGSGEKAAAAKTSSKSDNKKGGGDSSKAV